MISCLPRDSIGVAVLTSSILWIDQKIVVERAVEVAASA